MENERDLCPECGGEGRIPIGNRYVTRDMAIDAGDRSMEGMYYETEYARCRRCGGDGTVEAQSDGRI